MMQDGPRQNVVITDHNFEGVEQEQQVCRNANAELSVYQCRTASKVTKEVRGANVVVVQFAPLTAQAIEGLHKGARIIRYGVGYDNIDLMAAKRHECTVAYVPDYCTNEVADHTVSLLLCLLRKVSNLDRSVRNGEWDPVGVAEPMHQFSDTVIGFLGFGRIGHAVLNRLQPFGFQFAIHDPALNDHDVARVGARRMIDANDLFANSNAVTLHLPVTPATRHIVNSKSLALMKSGSVVVNTARGELIDEAAFASALETGRLAGAALDVFSSEPLTADHILRSAPNLLLSPHAAWYSDVSGAKLQGYVADEIRRGLAGEPARQQVPLG